MKIWKNTKLGYFCALELGSTNHPQMLSLLTSESDRDRRIPVPKSATFPSALAAKETGWDVTRRMLPTLAAKETGLDVTRHKSDSFGSAFDSVPPREHSKQAFWLRLWTQMGAISTSKCMGAEVTIVALSVGSMDPSSRARLEVGNWIGKLKYEERKDEDEGNRLLEEHFRFIPTIMLENTISVTFSTALCCKASSWHNACLVLFFYALSLAEWFSTFYWFSYFVINHSLVTNIVRIVATANTVVFVH